MLLTHVKLFLTAVFWGGTFIAGKLVAQHVPPFSAAFMRFLIAVFFLVFLTRRMETRFPSLNRRQFAIIGMLGMTGVFLYNFLFFLGLHHIDAGRASLIIAMNPVLIGAGAVLLYGEEMTPLKALGVALSVCGAMIVISRGDLSLVWRGGIGRGELYILGCVFSWVSFSLLGKLILGELSPLVSILYSSAFGMLALLAPACMEGLWNHVAAFGIVEWVGLLYLGFCGTVLGFVWYYEGIRKIGPTRSGLYINFVPVSAVVMAWLILGEAVTFSLILGAGLVTSGVVLSGLKR